MCMCPGTVHCPPSYKYRSVKVVREKGIVRENLYLSRSLRPLCIFMSIENSVVSAMRRVLYVCWRFMSVPFGGRAGSNYVLPAHGVDVTQQQLCSHSLGANRLFGLSCRRSR